MNTLQATKKHDRQTFYLMTYFSVVVLVLLPFDFRLDRLIFSLLTLLVIILPYTRLLRGRIQSPLLFRKLDTRKAQIARQVFVVSIYLTSLLAAAFGLIMLGLMGNPFKIWTFIYLSYLYLITLRLIEVIFDEGLLILKLIHILILSLTAYSHLNETKALWPNRHGEIFGLSARPYNEINAAGWDYAEDWYRIPATREEALTIVDHWKPNFTSRDGTCSLIHVPTRKRPTSFVGGFSPFEPINRKCEHWMAFDPCWIVERPFHIYYDDVSQQVIITNLTDF